MSQEAVSYTHLRAHETPEHLVCRLLLEKKKHISEPTRRRGISYAVFCLKKKKFFFFVFFFLMIRRPQRSPHCISSAASDVYKRQVYETTRGNFEEDREDYESASDSLTHTMTMMMPMTGGDESRGCLLYTSPSPRDS